MNYFISTIDNPMNDKHDKFCTTCGRTLTGRQKLFCSRVCHNKHGNTKLQTYEAQKTRAITRKVALIHLMGGKCCVCGYSKNISALCFHHINPLDKKGSLDSRSLANSTSSKTLSEVRKCILLCSNCHMELHNSDPKFVLANHPFKSPALTN